MMSLVVGKASGDPEIYQENTIVTHKIVSLIWQRYTL